MLTKGGVGGAGLWWNCAPPDRARTSSSKQLLLLVGLNQHEESRGLSSHGLAAAGQGCTDLLCKLELLTTRSSIQFHHRECYGFLRGPFSCWFPRLQQWNVTLYGSRLRCHLEQVLWKAVSCLEPWRLTWGRGDAEECRVWGDIHYLLVFVSSPQYPWLHYCNQADFFNFYEGIIKFTVFSVYFCKVWQMHRVI